MPPLGLSPSTEVGGKTGRVLFESIRGFYDQWVSVVPAAMADATVLLLVSPSHPKAHRSMRAALYFTPPRDADLTRIAAGWLGRDAFTIDAETAPNPLVAEPARYGFHATMKPPFRLADGRTLVELDETLAAFCRKSAPAAIRRLVLRRIGRFFALVPYDREPALAALADETVRRFEPFRAPLNEAEIARRAPERLTERQRENLSTWGYPYVFDEFHFHMTLTGPVSDADAPAVEARLAERFAAVLDRPLPIDGLALFAEDAPGRPFRVHALHPLQSEARTSP